MYRLANEKSSQNFTKSHPDSVLPKIEEINFETISMIFKDTIRLSMSDVNNEIQKGFAGRNDSSFAKGLRVGVAVFYNMGLDGLQFMRDAHILLHGKEKSLEDSDASPGQNIKKVE